MAQTTDVRTVTLRVTRVRRRSADPEGSASFYGWLLGVDASRHGGGWSVAFANGELAYDDDPDGPVAIEFAGADRNGLAVDPDGVAVRLSASVTRTSSSLPAIDHVALMCADVADATRFYQQLGMVITWSARGEHARDGVQDEPVAGADWVHVSGADGYLALSQADWEDYGTHTDAAGPPRFVHFGIAVDNLEGIAERLGQAGIPYLPAPSSAVGERLYLNDPDGDPRRGRNLELVQYTAGIARSGRL